MSALDSIEIADIAIIGAGVGGCIAALALARNYSVVLIDRHSEPAPRVGECLPPSAKRIFKQLDLLSILDETKHLTSHGMRSYWGSTQPQILDNLRNPDGHGWHIDRQCLETQLRQATQNRGVKCLWPMKLLASSYHASHWELTLAAEHSTDTTTTPSTIKARIVIDASGRASVFARQQGVGRQRLDNLVSSWATLLLPTTQQQGIICPDENGWWYSAPLPSLPRSADTHKPSTTTHKQTQTEQARVLCFQTDADLIEKSLTKSSESLLEAAAVLEGLSSLGSISNPHCFTHHGTVSASSSRLSHCAGERWFAIGDAAISFDPLSSQGMYNAMASAMQLSDLLLENGLLCSNACANYSLQVDNIWQYYLRHRQFFYKQETRWSNATFWRRRLT